MNTTDKQLQSTVPATTDDANEQAQPMTLNRRTFIQTSALVGGTMALATQLPGLTQSLQAATAPSAVAQDAVGTNGVYPLADPNNILYTACLQCNTGCAIKVKLIDGVIAKIDGNPFSPSTFWPYLDYE